MKIKGESIRCLLVLVAFFTGCVKNEPMPIESEQKNEIFFAPPVIASHVKAQAGAIDDIYPEGETFAVYAALSQGDFQSWDSSLLYMDDVNASYNEVLNGWKPEGEYYWPPSSKLTFAAYSPVEAVTNDMTGYSYGSEGFMFANFSVKSDPAQQYDLLYGPRTMNKMSSSVASGVYDGVDLNFCHALSSIEFKVRNGLHYEGSAIYIKGIKILNAFQKGTFNENISTTDESVYSAAPEWTGFADELGTGYSLTAGEVNQKVTEDAKEVEGSRSLLLLPQPLKHVGTGNNIIVQISYVDNGIDKVNNIDLVQGFDSDNDGVGDSYFNDGTKDITEWEPGKKYTYTITFGKYKIFFTPSVSDWASEMQPPIYI